MKEKIFRFVIIALLAVGVAPIGLAAEAGSPPAITSTDPDIPLDELSLRLTPLTRDELKVEVDAWQKLLQAKATEIGTAEIAVKHRKEELARVEDIEEAISDVDEAKEALSEVASEDKKDVSRAEEDLNEAEQEVKAAKEEALATVERTSADADVKKVEAVAAKKAAEEKRRQEQESADQDQGEKEGADDAEAKQALTAIERKLQQATEEREQKRAEVLTYLTELRAQQTSLIDHLNLAIDAYEKKGGAPEDIEQYRQYVSAVSGIKVDMSDMQATWATISGWMMSDEGGLRLLKNIALFLVIVLGAVFLSRLAARGTGKVLARTGQTSRLLGDFMVATVRRVVLIVGVLVGLAAMEVNVGPLLAVIGAAGFVIAFALQDSLGNFASGILILLFRPFDVGDVIEVAGVLGKVESMNLLSVQVRTPDNKAVIIPNNNVWSNSIINVTGTSTRRVDLVFGIAYDDDMGKAQKIMEDVVSAHEKVLEDPEPVVRVNELADSSVNFVCRPWVQTEDYWDVYWDITRGVKERFDQEGISIPFPQSDVHFIQELPVSVGDKAPADSSGKPGASAGQEKASKPAGRTASVDDQLRKNPEVIGDDVADDSV